MTIILSTYVQIKNGHYYFFNATAVYRYSVILDTYTIDLPEFKEKYYSAKDDTERVALNIQKIFEALNNKDYNYVYSKLAEGFKDKNFKTLESFEKYAKEKFFDNNEIEFLYYKKESDEYYSYTINVSDKKTEEVRTLTIIMQLKQGTNYVFSFDK